MASALRTPPMALYSLIRCHCCSYACPLNKIASSSTSVIAMRMLVLLCQGYPPIEVELLKSSTNVTLRHLLIGLEKNGRMDAPELLARSPQEPD